MEDIKMLVADDDRGLTRLLERTFAGLARVTCVHGGFDAVRRAVEELPDIIILDLGMPQLDGYQACQLLRADERTRDIPILMLTGHQDLAVAVEGFSRGIDAFVAKPVQLADLASRVRALLRWSPARRPS